MHEWHAAIDVALRPSVAASDYDLVSDGIDDTARTKDVGVLDVVERRVQSCRRITQVIEHMAALLTRLIGAKGEDLSIRCQDGVDGYDRPRCDRTPAARSHISSPDPSKIRAHLGWRDEHSFERPTISFPRLRAIFEALLNSIRAHLVSDLINASRRRAYQ